MKEEHCEICEICDAKVSFNSVKNVLLIMIFTELDNKLLSLQVVQTRPTMLGVVEEPLVLLREVQLPNHYLQMDMARLTRQLAPGPQGRLGREILQDLNLVVKILSLKKRIISLKRMKSLT